MESTEGIGRALWLTERRKGIGGTDAAAILGLSRWSTPYKVWLAKTRNLPHEPDKDVMYWGRVLEPVIAKRYMEETGLTVWDPKRLFYHPDHPELIGSPDRLVIGAERGLEIKTASIHVAKDWGAAGTDEIPKPYLVQCIHYMAITGFPRWDVAVLIGGSDFRIYRVMRDVQVESQLIRRLTAWWKHHVVEKNPPTLDGWGSTADAIARLFPADVGPTIDATPEANAAGALLASLRATLKSTEEAKRKAESTIKMLMGEASAIQGDGWRASWKKVRDRESVDYAAIGKDLLSGMDPDQAAAVIAKHTIQKSGYRRFLFTDQSSKEGESNGNEHG